LLGHAPHDVQSTLTFIGCADALTAALPHGETHAAVVAQIVPPIESSDEGVKVINRAEWESSEKDCPGVIEGGIDAIAILTNPIRRSLCHLGEICR